MKNRKTAGEPSAAVPAMRTGGDTKRAEISAPLLVSLSREAWADLIAHAKESLSAEVCGVLVGSVREGAETIVDVVATIRGTEAREARAHVTFTHETWNQIHSTLDRKYPDLQIVGWYHTHPGFGVEFSSMDAFIQQNFFSGRSQVAFLSDPLGSDVALARNGSEGIEYLSRFVVDGREHMATIPRGAGPEKQSRTGAAPDDQRLDRLEARISQLVQSLDEQQRNFYRMVMTLLVVGCLGVVATVGWIVLDRRGEQMKPPELQGFIPVPLRIGNETIMLGVGISKWTIPPRLDAYLEKVARIEVELRQQAAREREELERQKKLQTGEKP